MKVRMTALIASSLLIAATGYADGDITGSVFRKNTTEPLDFVNVLLIDSATGAPLPVGTVTDENGAFRIPDVAAGKYIVRISGIGSVSREIEALVAGADADLGRIELAEDASMLEEVVVTGRRSQISIDPDRRVFNVSSSISSAGASADELLAAIPSVYVDHDGGISLRGKDDVMVWVNGREMGMNDDNRIQLLRQIPAESIESIEVMTNPSSKHGTEGTAGIINIRLKEDHRHGYFGSAGADADTHGSVNANFNISYNEGKFESFAGLGLKSRHVPGGSTSRRSYGEGHYLYSEDDSRTHENSMFLRLGTNFRPDDDNLLYLSAIGTLGHKRGHTTSTHRSDLPGQWTYNLTHKRESGDTRGANILAGYRHTFRPGSFIDMSLSYNIWHGPNDCSSEETETWPGGMEEQMWLSQHQDVKISNWEAAADYSGLLLPWLRLEAGYKGNYNREDSPASYYSGATASALSPEPELFNRFKYSTDISALYVNLSGNYRQLTFSAGLRGEAWQIRTRSLGYGQTDADVPQFRKNDFALFPSLSAGWSFMDDNELKLSWSRRIRRPFGPQLNTFENIADPSEVHIGNPRIQPEYSDAVELSYVKNWRSHTLSVSGYLRHDTDMISHISFLAPMASDPDAETMYYGHANVGDMLNAGVEIVSRNTLFSFLTLTTTLNLYNSHLKAWSTAYPLHGSLYTVHGDGQDRFVWDARCMASVSLPWGMTFQATGRYNSRRITAQGTLESDWDVEAGLRKEIGAWGVSLVCKDIFNSKETRDILYGDGYTQSIGKWAEGRTLRLAVSYTFGKAHDHSHDPHNHIDTGGYGEEHSH